MSTQENVQIVKDFFSATGRGDRQGLLALCAEDVEWITPGEDWPLVGRRRGHAGLDDHFQKASETMETSFMEPREFVAQEDRVLVVGFARGRIKATNRMWKDHWFFAMTVRNGKLTNIREYVDAQALARASDAAGRGSWLASPFDEDDHKAFVDVMPTTLIVLQMAMEIEADPVEVATWYRDTRISELSDLTAAQLVSLGRADEVTLFLSAVLDGRRG